MGKKYVEDSSVALRKALNLHNCLAIVCTERQRASNDSFGGIHLNCCFLKISNNMDLGTF